MKNEKSTSRAKGSFGGDVCLFLLSMRQHCRDNVTMFLGHNLMVIAVFRIFVVATTFRN